MGWLSTSIGVGVGLSSAVYMNIIRKLPPLKEPWTHVGLAIGGGIFGWKYTQWRAQTFERDEALRRVIDERRRLGDEVKNEIQALKSN